MKRRYEIKEIEDGIQCRICCWKNWRQIVQIPFLYFFLLFFVYAYSNLINDNHHIAGYIFLLFIILIACIGTTIWLRNLFGQEIISINNSRLTIRNEILPDVGWNKHYIVSEIRNFALHGPFGPPSIWRTHSDMFSYPDNMEKWMSRGTIKFEHMGLTYYFAPKLYEEDAREIYEHVIKHLPATAFGDKVNQSTVPDLPTDGLL